MDYHQLCLVLHLIFCWKVGNLAAYEKCRSIIIPDLNECKIHGTHHLPVSKCVHNAICNKTFHISIIRMEPLSSVLIPDIFNYLLDVCCGTCTNTSVINNFTDGTKLNMSAIYKSHFVYPILGISNVKHYYGSFYLPLIEAPDTFLITKLTSSEDVLMRLVVSCANLWPLFVICLLMTIIAGFPVWLSETWFNEREFPRSFFVGLFEGFWWSFISMTTVGYGDKAPKFIVARFISVIWILIGITIISTFTAALTTEITSATTPVARVAGMKVGVLKGRVYDASIVLKKGGYVQVTEDDILMNGIVELITKLRLGRIYGFLIDRHAYTTVLSYFTNASSQVNHEMQMDALFFLNNTFHTVIDRSGEIYSYGVLVKDKADYQYFKQFVVDNHQYLQTCKELHMHKLPHDKAEFTHDIFSPNAGLFKISISISLILLAVIICVGLLYEIIRKKLCSHYARNTVVELPMDKPGTDKPGTS